MKRRVFCLLLVFCVLALPVQQVYAAPKGPAAKEEKEKPKPHEHKRKHKHEKKHKPEKPVPPHEKEKPGAEIKKPENIPVTAPTVAPTAVPTATPNPTAVPTVTPKPTVIPTVAPAEVPEKEEETPAYSAETDEIVKFALQFVGNPYKYGGSSLTNGADCSGFVQAVYKHFGYNLDRTSGAQAASSEYEEVAVKESELLPGDLIFYANSKGVVYHVALYIGNGKVVHAANTKKQIVVADYAYADMVPCIARRIIT